MADTSQPFVDVERDGTWSGTLLKTFKIGITSLGYLDKGTRKE